ncbi:AraC family transcriptional regulator [Acanthopleuribacter pedis]|uniref:AraC family transcriptional regulator ligand-binding domain-containing protein n=1 Tax=Acanthopleuribacter pedis TaxID=442870 RepID=A0A8J7QLU0_9BACT|nr:AraC family transcriptional regulator [Acanthopleuribacter pedis]MBO1320693.1 AraC family transcriptional regulator ligand-binding domain-containing protein [Acanthopleuribacter pedis]
MTASNYTINPGWRLILQDLGVHPGEVLRRAGLPEDLFARERAQIDTPSYFRLWTALDEALQDPRLPLRIGAAISVEAFDPPIFAALCSRDLNLALARIARYKKLVCPMELKVTQTDHSTRLGFVWLDRSVSPPPSLIFAEVVFFVQLARIATRHRVEPIAVTVPTAVTNREAYGAFLGVMPVRGDTLEVVFSARDAARPFLTANEMMWQTFEPALRQRRADLDQTAAMVDRVRGALLELLPSGQVSMGAVCDKLAVSRRTLQRKLAGEGVNFQLVLNKTRESLARHYLTQEQMTGAEISFLLGYDDPNSFFRAFQSWTGTTPARIRAGTA